MNGKYDKWKNAENDRRNEKRSSFIEKLCVRGCHFKCLYFFRTFWTRLPAAFAFYLVFDIGALCSRQLAWIRSKTRHGAGD